MVLTVTPLLAIGKALLELWPSKYYVFLSEMDSLRWN